MTIQPIALDCNAFYNLYELEVPYTQAEYSSTSKILVFRLLTKNKNLTNLNMFCDDCGLSYRV